MSTEDRSARMRSHHRALGLTLGAILVFGSMPLFSMLFGYRFLPSQEHVERFSLVSNGLLIIAGSLTFYLFALTEYPERSAEIQKRKHYSPQTKLAMAIFGGLLIGLLAKISVIATMPMARAVLYGDEVVLRYTVKDPSKGIDNRCPGYIELVSMPLLLDRVCGVSDWMRSRLEPGMQIELSGRGTSAGLFYDRLRTAQQAD